MTWTFPTLLLVSRPTVRIFVVVLVHRNHGSCSSSSSSSSSSRSRSSRSRSTTSSSISISILVPSSRSGCQIVISKLALSRHANIHVSSTSHTTQIAIPIGCRNRSKSNGTPSTGRINISILVNPIRHCRRRRRCRRRHQ
jgi:hypothetical protein